MLPTVLSKAISKPIIAWRSDHAKPASRSHSLLVPLLLMCILRKLHLKAAAAPLHVERCTLDACRRVCCLRYQLLLLAFGPAQIRCRNYIITSNVTLCVCVLEWRLERTGWISFNRACVHHFIKTRTGMQSTPNEVRSCFFSVLPSTTDRHGLSLTRVSIPILHYLLASWLARTLELHWFHQ